VFEVFGDALGDRSAAVGAGTHPFRDPDLVEDFAAPRLPIDVREFHTYATEWSPERVSFLVDDEVVRVVQQSPAYPMQFMLDVYAFPGDDGGPPPGPWPKELVVDSFRGWRPASPSPPVNPR
jgi:beta-glucanase (GH16 family)